MSSLAWLDFSEHERRKALDVIDLFKEKDTVDELGIGTIRDAFADLLFPGTSTIHTRARYFLFVPWTYMRLEQREIPSSQIESRARKEEVELIEALLRSDDTSGLIGKFARRKVRRLPSEIYWNGLGNWRIRLFQGSQHLYHRSLDRFYRARQAGFRLEGDELHLGGQIRNWLSSIPEPPDDFPGVASFQLRFAEAGFLRERIALTHPLSFLAYLVENELADEEVAFPWEHSASAKCPRENQQQLEHARNFSELMYGAQILYNLMLAEMKNDADGQAEYSEYIAEWQGDIDRRRPAHDRWDRNRFWGIVAEAGVRVTPQTRLFVDQWLDLARSAEGRKLIGSSMARQLVHQRERYLKRSQARLDGGRALELWRGASGTARLDYRWNAVVARFLRDLRDAGDE